MPMHTTYGRARTSVHEENASWNIWLAQTFNILNKGKGPTFVTSNRKEVTDLVLGTYNIGDLMINWHVSNESSLPNHRYILLQEGDLQVSRLIYSGPKRTNWESYREDIKARLGCYAHGAGYRTGFWYVATGQPQVLSPKLASQGGCLAKEGSLLEKKRRASLKPQEGGFLIKLKGWVTGNHTGRLSPVITKRL